MQQVSLDEAEKNLRELIRQVAVGNEIMITDQGNRPLAKLVYLRPPGWERKAGNAEGKVWMAEDFDDPIEDFGEYMP